MKSLLKAAIWSLFAILVLAAATPRRAAEVTLRSGRVIEGNIVGQTDSEVTIEDADGIRSAIPMDKVDRIMQAAPAMPAPGAAAPQLIIQSGHTDRSTAVAFSPDGKYLASASSDETVKIWLPETGELFRTLTGHTLTVSAMTFCADGMLATSSWDATIKLWDPETGDLIRTFGTPLEQITNDPNNPNARNDNYEAVACSASGKLIAGGDRDAIIRVFDRNTGAVVNEVTGFNDTTSDLLFSPDDTRVLAIDTQQRAGVWRLDTGEQTVALPHENGARGLALSRDGMFLAVAGKDMTIAIWNTETGLQEQTLRGHASNVNTVAFSPDGKSLISGDYDGAALLWDLSTSKWNHLLEAHAYGINDVAVNPALDMAATAGGDGAVKLWNLKTGAPMATLQGLGRGMQYAAFSPDGSLFAAGGWDKKVTIRSTMTGRTISVLDGIPSTVGEFAFSPDGARIAVKCQDGLRSYNLTVWDIKTGALLHSLGDSMDSVAWSPDGKLIAAGSEYEYATVWDAATGELVYTLQGHGEVVFATAFSPDGRFLATGSFSGEVKIWSLITGECVRTIKAHDAYVYDVAWSPDGKRLVSGGGDTKARIWSAETGDLIRTLDGHKSWVLYTAFSPDGRTISTSAGDMTVRLWDAHTGALLHTLEGHFGDVAAAAWSPDSKHIISAADDSTIRLWDPATGEAQAVLIPLAGADWILVTPRGYFDMTDAARKIIRWRAGNKLYAPEQFFDEYYRPGLFELVIAGQPVPRSRDIRTGFATPPDIKILDLKDGADLGDADKITINVRATDTGGGIKRVRVYVNGKLTGQALEFKDKEGSFQRPFIVDLLPGENIIEATAFSRDHIETRRDTIHVWRQTGEMTRQKLYILSVGVSQYKDATLALTYPDKDAEQFAATLETGARNLFSEVHRYDLLNQDATMAGIKDTMRAIQNMARPEDVVILFLAGHGITLDDAYFFIPQDLIYNSDADIVDHGLSQAELMEFLAGVSARKTLLVLDTCGSGGMVVAMNTRGMAEKRALALLAKSAGSFLIAASSDTQEALEVTGLEHGLLTYTVLQALKGSADTSPQDGMITVLELLPFIQQRVPEFAQQHFHRAQYPQIFSNGMDFPLIVNQ
jgi:WD40 repeat protein